MVSTKSVAEKINHQDKNPTKAVAKTDAKESNHGDKPLNDVKESSANKTTHENKQIEKAIKPVKTEKPKVDHLS